MATGVRPFQGKSLAAMCEAIMDRAPVPPSQVNRDVPAALQDIIVKALQKDLALRYQRASEMRADLEALTGTVTSAIAAAPPARRMRRWTAVAAGLALAAAAAAGVRWWPVRRPAPLTEKDTIVLADFVNTTGDPVFEATLKQGLSVQLRQSPFLNIVPDQKLGETLKLMGRAPGDPLTPQLARDACVRTGSKAMLTGSISTLGSHYVLGLRAQECYSGANLAEEQEQAARKEDVLKALDQAAARVRRTLGESLSTVQKYDVPVEQTTTSSLEALQAYSLGLKSFQEKGDAAAMVFHKRAVELDPEFAMAYVALGASSVNLSQQAQGRAAFEKPYALRDRASERERYRITAEYFIFVTGEVDKATLVYEQWAWAYRVIPVPSVGWHPTA